MQTWFNVFHNGITRFKRKIMNLNRKHCLRIQYTLRHFSIQTPLTRLQIPHSLEGIFHSPFAGIIISRGSQLAAEQRSSQKERETSFCVCMWIRTMKIHEMRWRHAGNVYARRKDHMLDWDVSYVETIWGKLSLTYEERSGRHARDFIAKAHEYTHNLMREMREIYLNIAQINEMMIHCCSRWDHRGHIVLSG